MNTYKKYVFLVTFMLVLHYYVRYNFEKKKYKLYVSKTNLKSFMYQLSEINTLASKNSHA